MEHAPNRIVRCGPGLLQDEIDDLEQRLSTKLPASLRELYATANGGSLEKRRCKSSGGEVFVFHEFLEVSGKPNKGLELAWDVCHIDPGFMPDGLHPFANDGGGDFFCVRSSDEAVIFFDSANTDNLEWAVNEVAPSMRAFISNMT